MRNIPINVSRKILADVSSGIYRTPANALKELVSNAFDAGATEVFISTNAPYFDLFTCEDNGKGMSVIDFEKIIGRIGNSTKRSEAQKNILNRPIIGKIGIGLLAIAQICRKFTVISKKADSEFYFQATIDLKQFDEVEKEIILHEIEGTSNKQIGLGKCEIEDGLIDEINKERQYTKIIMEDIKQGFKEKLIGDEEKRIFGNINEVANKSSEILDIIENLKGKSFNELSQYDQLIWELCINCPLKYLDDGPLPDNLVLAEEIDELISYNFNVTVDGFELRKPLLFPTESNLVENEIDYKIYPKISFSEEIEEHKLKFTGYIFNQRKKIKPAEAIGILIRIKGVAIGNYDKTFLHYPKAEGPMINLLSGEIFVDEGLEEALNIDRNSFNESHPHYLRLQNEIWDFLGGENGVFKDIRKRSKERNDNKRTNESEKTLEKTINFINQNSDIVFKFERLNELGNTPYFYDKIKNKLTFYDNSFWSKNKYSRLQQEKLVLAIVAARNISNSIESFEKNILQLLNSKN